MNCLAANGCASPSEAIAPRDGRLATAGTPAARLWEQSVGFEELLLQQLLSRLRQTVDQSGGILAPSAGRRMFEQTRDEKLAGLLASEGRVGLADRLYTQYRPRIEAEARREQLLSAVA